MGSQLQLISIRVRKKNLSVALIWLHAESGTSATRLIKRAQQWRGTAVLALLVALAEAIVIMV